MAKYQEFIHLSSPWIMLLQILVDVFLRPSPHSLSLIGKTKKPTDGIASGFEFGA